MKKLFVFLFVFLSFTSYAQTFEVDGVIYRILNNEYVEISSVNEDYLNEVTNAKRNELNNGSLELATLVIPDKVNFEDKGYSVTGIGEFAFDDNKSIEKIILPQTIEYIGFGAFAGSSLKYCSLPDSLKEIGMQAFSGCSIKKVFIPESVIKLGEDCFARCPELEAVDFDKKSKLTTIPINCFTDCKKIKEINLPESVSVIDDAAFCACDELEKFHSDGILKSIGEVSFSGCEKLSQFNCMVSEMIGALAFNCCTSLKDFDLYADNVGIDAFVGSGIEILRIKNLSVVGLTEAFLPKWKENEFIITIPQDILNDIDTLPEFLKYRYSIEFSSDILDSYYVIVKDRFNVFPDEYYEISKNEVMFSLEDKRNNLAWTKQDEEDLFVKYNDTVINESNIMVTTVPNGVELQYFLTEPLTRKSKLYVGSMKNNIMDIQIDSLDNEIYDISGRKINYNKVNDNMLLPPGIYIKKGVGKYIK